jgi:polyhydroxybutyrate depolymerase
MRSPLIVAAALCALSAGGAARAGEPHTVERTLAWGGRERTYLLHVPPQAREAKHPVPLVLAFHGGGSRARGMEWLSGLDAISDREGFVVAYPDAWEKAWNDGRGAGGIAAQREGVDDVGFACAIIDAVAGERAIDPGAVFATGISNGGFFCERLAAERADRIAAIAPVAGGMAARVAETLAPARPVSVLFMNGTKDPLVPYEGGAVAWGLGGRGTTIPVREAAAAWGRADACKGDPVVEDVPDRDPGDGARATRTTWSGGAEGSEVVLYTIEGGGHTWPGGAQYLPRVVIGGTCRDFQAEEVMWEFFVRHRRRAGEAR